MVNMAERIKEQRKKNGITQEELAEKVSCSVMTIKRIESKKELHTPNVSLIAKIAKVLNTSVDYLMGTEKEKTPEIIIEHRKEEQPLRIIYDYGNHHFDLPATPEGYKAFTEALSVMSKMNAPAAVGA